jgi:hypothetical protein
VPSYAIGRAKASLIAEFSHPAGVGDLGPCVAGG